MSKIAELRLALVDAKMQYQSMVKTCIEQGAEILFKEYPQLQTICWYSYTPYFNDGDPCEYTLNGAWYTTLTIKQIEEDGKLVNQDFDDGEEVGGRSAHMVEFDKILHENSDVVEIAYGTYSKVFITRNGTTILEYDYEG